MKSRFCGMGDKNVNPSNKSRISEALLLLKASYYYAPQPSSNIFMLPFYNM